MNAIIGFVARSIEEEPEMPVAPDPRTKTVLRNPARTLEIDESTSEPDDYEFSVQFDGPALFDQKVSGKPRHGAQLEPGSLCRPVEFVSNDGHGFSRGFRPQPLRLRNRREQLRLDTASCLSMQHGPY